MIAATSNVPTGPIKAHRWSIAPITHVLRSRDSRHSLRVRTGFLRFGFTFLLSPWLFFLFSFVLRTSSLTWGISVLAAFGLTALILRFYRSLFWEVTFDTSRQVVELQRRGRIETVAIGCIIGFQICRCVDKKTTGLIRYHNDFHQLILVYEDQGEYHRRLITAATRGACSRLVSRLAEHMKIDVKHYAD